MEPRQQYESQDQDQQPHTSQSSSELKLVPFVEIGGEWILSDGFLEEIFNRAHREGLLGKLFWDGSVVSPQSFVGMCKNRWNILAFVFRGHECVGFAWLNGVASNYSFGHFCMFRTIWGKEAIAVGKMYLDYWFSFPGNDGPLLDTIIGMIPGCNRPARAYVRRLGFEHLGSIPGMLKNKRGDREDAIAFFKRRD